jgi:DNA-binding NarL/FixJ family response regulator
MPVRILLALDKGIVCEGIKVLLSSEKNLKIVGETTECNELASKIKKTNTHIVLLDADAVLMNAFECAQIVKNGFPSVRLLVLAMIMNEQQMRRFMDLGADGFILKNTTKEELVYAIDKIANDGTYIGPEFVLNLLSKNRMKTPVKSDKSVRARTLTFGEMQILDLIVEGKTNAEMAKILFVSVRAVETRRKKILEKTGTTNTATLVKHAIEKGLI